MKTAIVLALITFSGAHFAIAKETAQVKAARTIAQENPVEFSMQALSKLLNHYLNLSDVKALIANDPKAFPNVLGTATSKLQNKTQFRAILAIGRKGSVKPIFSKEPSTLKILNLTIDQSANSEESIETISDLTKAQLPAGTFDACFWIPKTKHPEGINVCFPITEESDKRTLRLYLLGYKIPMIPWRKPSGKVSLAETTPEECDGTWDDQNHNTGWCPWGAQFSGLFEHVESGLPTKQAVSKFTTLD